MSESNISEKIIESITNIFKKTIIFEKTERIEGIFIGVAIFTSIFGLFTMYNSYKLNNIDEQINNINYKITSIEKVVKENSDMPKLYYKILLEGNDVFFTISRQQVYTDQRINNLNERINKVIALLEDKKENN